MKFTLAGKIFLAIALLVAVSAGVTTYGLVRMARTQ